MASTSTTTGSRQARRKFFKTVITVEVLSEDEYPTTHWDLENISNAMTHGSFVGQVSVSRPKRLTNKQMLKEIDEMRSDPSFFSLDERGRTKY